CPAADDRPRLPREIVMLPRRFAPGVVLAATALALAPVVADAPARKLWTTSRVVGSPDPPPPYRTVNAFPHVRLTHPLPLVATAASSRAEREANPPSSPTRPHPPAEPFLDLTKELKTIPQHPGAKDVEAVYGLAFHPKFAENRYCYVCYTLRGKKNEKNLPDG